ncbi:Spc19-domain-containing protein [Amylostereum chailletii]|nr:Spc19-domain-containing protein [Amylostereum chailletii]
MTSFRASTGPRRRFSTYPKGRESIFSGGSEICREDAQAVFSPNLRECVLTMEDCCEEAHEAQQFLRNGTYDLPRMSRVLENERVFLLVDEATVRKYKADLAEEIEPQVTELIARAEKGLKALQKKESSLQTKVETAQTRPTSLATVGTTAANKAETRKLQLLVRQREQLEEQLRHLESEILTMV